MNDRDHHDEQRPPAPFVESFMWPLLSGITALSFMGIAGASLATYGDVGIIKNRLETATQAQIQLKAATDTLTAKVLSIEIRLARKGM